MERMSAEEFRTWVALDRMEPAGDRLVASMLFNVNRKADTAFQMPQDFMTAIREQPEERAVHIQTPREIAAVFLAAEPKKVKRARKKTSK